MPGFKNGKVVSIAQPATTYVDVVFETDEPLDFAPGQFISIRVNERDIRSYSLAGRVGERCYGLIVDVKPGGPGSVFFDTLTVGQTFAFLGPIGKFVYVPDDGAEALLFVATGTGVAPLKAMIEQAMSTGDTRPMTLLFGLRHVEDIFWDGYFNTLQREHVNFRFVLCLSQPDEQWQGVRGRVTEFIKNEYTDLSTYAAYLCGNGGMITEAVSLLESKQMRPELIYHEKFF